MKIPFSLYDFFGYLSAGLVVGFAYDLAFLEVALLSTPLEPLPGLLLVLGAYVLGHGVAHLASTLIENLFVHRVLGPSEVVLFNPKPTSRWRYLFPGYFRPLPPETRRRALERASSFGIDAPSRGFFFHCHPRVLREEIVQGRLSTFLALYGFARNLSMAFLLSTAIVTAAWIEGSYAGAPAFRAASAGVLLAILLLYRYLLFYRLYTVEVFRSYAEADTTESDDPKSA